MGYHYSWLLPFILEVKCINISSKPFSLQLAACVSFLPHQHLFSIGQSYHFLRDMLRKCRNGYLHISRFLWQSFFDMSRYMYTFLWLNENLKRCMIMLQRRKKHTLIFTVRSMFQVFSLLRTKSNRHPNKQSSFQKTRQLLLLSSSNRGLRN